MYQKVILIGNLSSETSMKFMPDGTAITTFNMATNTRWNDKATGQPKEEVTWWRISVWGSQAERANEYLSKGSKVLVEGQIKPDPQTGNPRIWTDKQGVAHASYELKAETVRFLSGKSDVQESGNAVSSSQAEAVDEDEVPF